MPQFLTGALAALLFAVAGCAPSVEPAEVADDASAAALFHEGKGLKLNAETRQSLHLEVGMAAPRVLHPVWQASAQVLGSPTGPGGWSQASALLPAAINTVRPGQPVILHAGSKDPHSSTGTVARVDERVRQALGQMEVVIAFPDPDGRFATGSFVPATFLAGERSVPVAVPVAAVVRAGLGDFVYLSDGEFFKRAPVTVGAQDPDGMEIVSGLPAGQPLVIRGAAELWLLELSEVGGMTNLK